MEIATTLLLIAVFFKFGLNEGTATFFRLEYRVSDMRISVCSIKSGVLFKDFSF